MMETNKITKERKPQRRESCLDFRRINFNIREVPVSGKEGVYGGEDVLSVLPARYWRKHRRYQDRFGKQRKSDTGAYFNLGVVIGGEDYEGFIPEFISIVDDSRMEGGILNPCGDRALYQYEVQAVLDAAHLLLRNGYYEISTRQEGRRNYCQVLGGKNDFVADAKDLAKRLCFSWNIHPTTENRITNDLVREIRGRSK